MHRYEGPHSTLTMALDRGLSIGIIVESYEGPLTALTITLHAGLH
jgi:hypothetical protein